MAWKQKAAEQITTRRRRFRARSSSRRRGNHVDILSNRLRTGPPQGFYLTGGGPVELITRKPRKTFTVPDLAGRRRGVSQKRPTIYLSPLVGLTWSRPRRFSSGSM